MDCDGFCLASAFWIRGGKLKKWTDLLNDRFVVAAPIVTLALLHRAVEMAKAEKSLVNIKHFGEKYFRWKREGGVY